MIIKGIVRSRKLVENSVYEQVQKAANSYAASICMPVKSKNGIDRSMKTDDKTKQAVIEGENLDCLLDSMAPSSSRMMTRTQYENPSDV